LEVLILGDVLGNGQVTTFLLMPKKVAEVSFFRYFT